MSQIFDVAEHAIQDRVGQLRFGLFSAPEHDGDLDFVPLFEEPLHVFDFECIIMDADLRAEFYLFDLYIVSDAFWLPALSCAVHTEIFRNP